MDYWCLVIIENGSGGRGRAPERRFIWVTDFVLFVLLQFTANSLIYCLVFFHFCYEPCSEMDDHHLEVDCMEIFKQWNLCGSTIPSSSNAQTTVANNYIHGSDLQRTGESMARENKEKTGFVQCLLIPFLSFICFICCNFCNWEGRLVCELAESDRLGAH